MKSHESWRKGTLKPPVFFKFQSLPAFFVFASQRKNNIDFHGKHLPYLEGNLEARACLRRFDGQNPLFVLTKEGEKGLFTDNLFKFEHSASAAPITQSPVEGEMLLGFAEFKKSLTLIGA